MQAIVTPDEMAAIDAAAPESVEVLIERAGWAVARAALELLGGTYGKRVVVLAGKGNNGNDGRAAARFLTTRGVRCTVVDAAAAPAALPEADLVIDAAYGTGFQGHYRPPDLADVRTPVLAVDIPSGIDGVTGEAADDVLTALQTVTFAAVKPGLLLADGSERAGEVTVADIGLDVSGATAHLVESADLKAWMPPRPRAAHKWQTATWLVAGSPGMSGAAHLAARAAQRGGAGYVRCSTPGGSIEGGPIEAVTTELPADDWAREIIEDSGRFSAIAVGPGLGTDSRTAEQVRSLVSETTLPIVVDGDGLRALGQQAGRVIAARPPGAAAVVLTPHDGEFEALSGSVPPADRFAAVRRLAVTAGAVVLLKGPTTLVAEPDGSVLAVTAGDHRLATAGTGDVLTGLVVALLAQGMAPPQAAAAAAHLHGAAGALACPRGLVAGDLLDHLPIVLTAAFGA
ncbi:MAG: NAD(P)H-hydrate dehydratase [Aquihabitans sp.]